MTPLSPKHRRPKVITGGKPLKTDLRLEGTGRSRKLSTAPGAECDTARSDHIEASRLLIDEARNRLRGANSRHRAVRKD